MKLMKKNKKSILVPTDFKKVASYALQHAIRVSQVVGEEITIFHVVKSSSDVLDAQHKLEQVAKETKEKLNLLPNVLVGVGDIATEIATAAVNLNASLVIMGSESVKGKEDLNSLPTLGVITKSKVPFITIQEPPINRRYDDIVFPIDDTIENREKHSWISYFCDYYVSRFHLIKPNVTDPELVAKVDLNMASAIRFLHERGAKYIVYTVPGKKEYGKEILDMAVNIRADLIVIMTSKACDDCEAILEPHEQFIIGHAAHIPVMSINPL
jgi:nucleotide-binding universal stress UspA family protein